MGSISSQQQGDAPSCVVESSCFTGDIDAGERFDDTLCGTGSVKQEEI
jgi:hypothetical protein